MDPTTSSSPSPDRRSPARFKPTQPVADRIVRALRHRLRLLHRSDADFYILGATCNVYTVTLSDAPSCTCPDRTIPCKHILFVFLRVLGISVDDICLRRKTLRPCQLRRLLGTPISNETLAGPRIRERFHQLFWEFGQARCALASRVEDCSTCPVCLEEMGKEERVVACGVCRNSLHEECLLAWKRSSGRRRASCVICRARWRERKEQEGYLNLAAYISEDEGEIGGLCVA
ncbi:SWIM zinc finger family protein / mitogen-activated protein kinase kinase kinase (MAPKKK)-like protein [Tasmannia lanceolata]|uniref:SWIM zinc finger family protein / mitogen-activated protein kinase kinase kinase (MAPKKK)-like protein n=1 Tax=Tasmannia lanceolata TaxID=3420 RepID=UPI004062D864